MRLPAGVFARGSTFWCRIIIPKDLRHLYRRTASGALATTHSCISLQTSDRAEARARGLARRAEVEAEFLEKRKELARPVTRPTRAMIAMLEDRIRHRILAEDDARRVAGKALEAYPLQVEGMVPAKGAMGRLDQLQAVEELYTAVLGKTLAAGSTWLGRSHAEVEARELGLTIDWAGYDADLLRLSRAASQAYADAAKRTRGELVATPEPPGPPELPEATGKAPAHLRDVVQHWKAARSPKADAIEHTERSLRQLEASGQDHPLSKLSRAHGAALRAYLRSEERPYGHKRGLNYWSALIALLNVAVDVEMILRNPWAKLDFPVADSETREPYSAEELSRLFGSSLFKRGEWPTVQLVDCWDAYFGLLLGLWSGARVGEIAQLEIADVRAVNGVMILDIHGRAGTVKTPESVRKVPLAPEVVRLGFTDFVEDRRRSGAVKVFPSLHRAGKVGPGDLLSEWMRDYRAKVGIESGPLKGFHCFRHTIRSRMAALHIGVETADALTGHAARGSSGRKVYTHVGADTVRDALARVGFGLSLPRVYPKRGA